MTTAETFRVLFRGRNDAFGLAAGGVVRRPVSDDLYHKHLSGRQSLGIFPLLDDGTVHFGAVDLDEPDEALAREIADLLPQPTWIAKSRSGNYHIYVFFERPAPAWAVQGLLREACVVLDRPRAEVFPKQTRLLEGMVGNYINLPLFGMERPFMGFEDPSCLRLMYEARQDPDVWVRRCSFMGITEPSDEVKGDGTTGVLHICAEKIITDREINPLVKGHRNVVMFNLAKQLIAYREFDDAEALAYCELVGTAAVPPMGTNSVRKIFQSARRGGYRSTGCDDPLMAPYVHPDCPIARKT